MQKLAGRHAVIEQVLGRPQARRVAGVAKPRQVCEDKTQVGESQVAAVRVPGRSFEMLNRARVDRNARCGNRQKRQASFAVGRPANQRPP